MAETDHTARRIDCRIVYCGPPNAGKTTNLQHLYERLHPDTRGKLISPASVSDHTFFFDFLAVDLGRIVGYETRFHLYTIPGETENTDGVVRILRGADAIVLVVDSGADRLEENERALERLEEVLERADRSLDELILAFQYNKRDLPDALPVSDLEERLNSREVPHFEAVATSGEGVVETVEGVGADVVSSLDVEGLDA